MFDELLEFGDRSSGKGWHKATIKKIEAAYSKFSSRSSCTTTLMNYFLAYQVYEHVTLPYYMDSYLRYFRLRRYANTASTEHEWISTLRRVYGQGKAENIVVVIGDWCMRGARNFGHRQRRPAAYSRLLHRLRAAGIVVFLVDESYTSKRCSHCKDEHAICSGETIPDILVSHGQGRYRRIPQSHGRVVCRICKQRFNRDVNASENILCLAISLLTTGCRPGYLPVYQKSALPVDDGV